MYSSHLAIRYVPFITYREFMRQQRAVLIIVPKYPLGRISDISFRILILFAKYLSHITTLFRRSCGWLEKPLFSTISEPTGTEKHLSHKKGPSSILQHSCKLCVLTVLLLLLLPVFMSG